MKLETKQSAYHHGHGFTLIEILVAITIVALLATIAISNFMIARDNARLTRIRTNLRQIESAKDQWAIDNGQPTGAPVSAMSDLSDYRPMPSARLPQLCSRPALVRIMPATRLWHSNRNTLTIARIA